MVQKAHESWSFNDWLQDFEWQPGVIFSTVKHILLDCTRRAVFMHVHPMKTKALEQYLAARN